MSNWNYGVICTQISATAVFSVTNANYSWTKLVESLLLVKSN